MTQNYRLLTAGDSAVVVEFGNEISEMVNNRVRSMHFLLEKQQVDGIIECVPTYRSLMVHYNPRIVAFDNLAKELASLAEELENFELPAPEIVEIPTCYGGEFGPDIVQVAAHNQLSVEEVISIHTEKTYLIYMLGFTPGFPYLGGMDPRIATPRLESPRTRIRAGSVGIAGNQTGIYSIDSPGGWQLIGWTPVRLYDPEAAKPILLKAGNRIKFKAVAESDISREGLTHSLHQAESISLTEDQETALTIIKPGMLTTVQDAGRTGFQQYGVPVSGVMDSYAYRAANLLTGNEPGAAVLEVTLMGPVIEFNREMEIAVTGGDLSPELNGQELPMWRNHLVKTGDRLSFKGVRQGCRSYIAFSGGLDVPQIMGSRSTYTRGGLGGYNGRALKIGDQLEVKPANAKPSPGEHRLVQPYPDLTDPQVIHVIAGPQEEAFTNAGISTFYRETYTVTNDSDRMGCRLEGPVIGHREGADIISDGIAMGAIQIPGHGMPIIMMADRQTTGGYTKIATVISADLPKMAQIKPGSRISFQRVTVEEAHRLLHELEAGLKAVDRRPVGKETKQNDQQVHHADRHFKIHVKDRQYEVTVREQKE